MTALPDHDLHSLRQLFREWGLPTTGDVFGVASGVAVVLALVELAGSALGLALARLLALYRR